MNLRLLFPSFAELKGALVSYHEMFFVAWRDTATISIVACCCSLLLSLMLSLLCLRFSRLAAPFNGLVAISQSFPLQAIAPLLVVVLGHGPITKLTVAIIITFFPLYAVSANALQSTPESLLNYGKVIGLGYVAELWHIRIPAALPAICGASKVAFTLSVLGTVVAEFINPVSGVGRLLVLAQSQFDVANIYICISILALQGFFIFTLLGLVERKLIETRRL